MLVYGLSGIVGLIGGGIAADRLYRTRKDGRLLVATAGHRDLRAVHVLVADAARRAMSPASRCSWVRACGVMYAYYATVYSTIQDVVEPSLRGTAMALYFGAMYLAGASLGPLGTGMISDVFTARAARAAGLVAPTAEALEPFRGAGLHAAMYAIPILAVLLALVLFAASRTVRRDIEALRAWMAASS